MPSGRLLLSPYGHLSSLFLQRDWEQLPEFLPFQKMGHLPTGPQFGWTPTLCSHLFSLSTWNMSPCLLSRLILLLSSSGSRSFCLDAQRIFFFLFLWNLIILLGSAPVLAFLGPVFSRTGHSFSTGSLSCWSAWSWPIGSLETFQDQVRYWGDYNGRKIQMEPREEIWCKCRRQPRGKQERSTKGDDAGKSWARLKTTTLGSWTGHWGKPVSPKWEEQKGTSVKSRTNYYKKKKKRIKSLYRQWGNARKWPWNRWKPIT